MELQCVSPEHFITKRIKAEGLFAFIQHLLSILLNNLVGSRLRFRLRSLCCLRLKNASAEDEDKNREAVVGQDYMTLWGMYSGLIATVRTYSVPALKRCVPDLVPSLRYAAANTQRLVLTKTLVPFAANALAISFPIPD